MQEGRLSSIIKTQEQELGMLVEQTERCENVVKPVDNPHFEIESELDGKACNMWN
jgi:hypothetical protein